MAWLAGANDRSSAPSPLDALVDREAFLARADSNVAQEEQQLCQGPEGTAASRGGSMYGIQGHETTLASEQEEQCLERTWIRHKKDTVGPDTSSRRSPLLTDGAEDPDPEWERGQDVSSNHENAVSPDVTHFVACGPSWTTAAKSHLSMLGYLSELMTGGGGGV